MPNETPPTDTTNDENFEIELVITVERTAVTLDGCNAFADSFMSHGSETKGDQSVLVATIKTRTGGLELKWKCPEEERKTIPCENSLDQVLIYSNDTPIVAPVSIILAALEMVRRFQGDNTNVYFDGFPGDNEDPTEIYFWND